MAAIEVVIKIPKEIYEIAKQNKWKYPADDVYNAIKNGTTLPKGHGRLIDADKLRAVYTKPHLVGFDEIIEDIDSQPTVLKGEE